MDCFPYLCGTQRAPAEERGLIITNNNKYYMKAKSIILSALLVVLTMPAMAEMRSEADLLRIASKALCSEGLRRAPSNRTDNLRVVRATEQLTCIGGTTGGFVVLANDDAFEPVLAIVSEPYAEKAQPAFEWWLRAADEALAHHCSQLTGVSAQHPASVDPFILTKWGQDAPFYDQDVIEADGTRYQMVTGCVATAMAQVIRYYSYPEHGVGHHRYSTRYSNIGTIYHEVDYASHTYDYQNMLFTYPQGGYDAAQGTAVATLMRDCGVAVDMKYNGTGSSSSSEDVPQALRTYFGYNPYIRQLKRDRFSDSKWVGMVYAELAAHRPVLYSGQDPSSGGHAFLLDGYNEQGLVHVNWGWAGLYDGWFDLSILQPDENNYSAGQDMVIGIQPAPEQLRSRTLEVDEMGTLSSLITDQEKYSLQSLTLTGDLNSDDIAFLRDMMGLGATAQTEGLLTEIDLSGCTIFAGGNPFWSGYSTTKDVLPQYLFTLIDGGYGVTTSGLSRFAMPNTTMKVGRYSMFSCPAVTELVIPASVLQIEDEVSVDAYNLHALYFLSPTPPSAASPLTKINLGECTLYVPQGARAAYLDAAYWMTFGNVVEIASPYCNLTAAPADPDKGTVEGSGRYLYNQTVCLRATGKSGYKFDQWSDGDRHRVRQLTLTGDQTLTASFVVGTEETALEGTEAQAGLNTSEPMYNVLGQQVDASYRGVVIQNGKKYLSK